jgi:GDPmannose 4,6-dehydratase
MWMILQQPQGDDYVIASGETHTIREFLDASFGLVGLDWHPWLSRTRAWLRPAEVPHLHGDFAKAGAKLGWETKTSFKELVKITVTADLELEGLDPKKYLSMELSA